jgi:hypothetical protein
MPLVPVFLLLTAVAAFASDIQVTANAPPDSAKCSLTSPSAQCGQWTYWASLGALVIGLFVVITFVVKYLKDAPRFQVEADGRAAPGRAQAVAGASRALAPPPPATAPAPAATVAATQSAADPGASATAVAVADPPAVASEDASAPAAAAPAEPAAAPRPPSPRPEPVEPDQATYDKTLAEQLAKGTDRRVAEGRAKAAALKAAREKAAG